MDTLFLNRIIAKKMMAQQQEQEQEHEHGIAITRLGKLVAHKDVNDRYRRILVIPSGIGSTNLDHLRGMRGVTIARGIDRDYASNDDSFEKFVGTIATIRPTLIVAGSRGAELVARVLKDNIASKQYGGPILLFGPVFLSDVFEAKRKNKLFIVHGSDDKNEQIGGVRALVATHNNKKLSPQQGASTLIEATTQGHSLSFPKQTMSNILKYVTLN